MKFMVTVFSMQGDAGEIADRLIRVHMPCHGIVDGSAPPQELQSFPKIFWGISLEFEPQICDRVCKLQRHGVQRVSADRKGRLPGSS